MIDNKTSHLSLPLPDLGNMQDEDVPRITQAFRMIDTHAQGVDDRALEVEDAINSLDDKLKKLGSDAQEQSERIDLQNQNLAMEAEARTVADTEAAARIGALFESQEAAALRMNAVERDNTEQDARLDGVESSVTALVTTLLGSVQAVMAADGYVPNGCVPANGGEYTRAQFPTLYDAYLTEGKLITCTYEQQAIQVGLTGNCGKFALDPENQKFKVPLLKDGDSITQAASAAELGNSVKAGLPNVKWSVNIQTGVFNAAYLTGAAQVGTTKSPYYWSQSSGTYAYPDYSVDLSRVSPVYRNDVTTVLTDGVRLRHFVVVASAQNSASVFDWSNYMAALAGKANTDLSNVTGNAIGQYFFVRDERPSGTNGGSTTSGAWQTRVLNTAKNSCSWASLANNRITLPAGKYYIKAEIPVLCGNGSRAAVYDNTHASYLAYSPSCYSSSGDSTSVLISLQGEITLAAQADIELRMYVQASHANGCGTASSSGAPEVYSEVRVWKM